MKEFTFQIEGKCYFCGRTSDAFKNEFGLTQVAKQLEEKLKNEEKKSQDEIIKTLFLEKFKKIRVEADGYSSNLTLKEIRTQITTLKKIYPHIEEFIQSIEELGQFAKINLMNEDTINSITEKIANWIQFLEQTQITTDLKIINPQLYNEIQERIRDVPSDDLHNEINEKGIHSILESFQEYGIRRIMTFSGELATEFHVFHRPDCYKKDEFTIGYIRNEDISQIVMNNAKSPGQIALNDAKSPSQIGIKNVKSPSQSGMKNVKSPPLNPEKPCYLSKYDIEEFARRQGKDFFNKLYPKIHTIHDFRVQERELVPENQILSIRLRVKICPICAEIHKESSLSALNILTPEEEWD